MNYLIYAILFFPPLVFFTDLTRNPYYFQIVLLNSLTVLLWIVWFYKNLKNSKLSFLKTPFDIPLSAFFFIATVSCVLALIENYSHPYLKYSIYSEGFKRWLYLLVNSILVYYIPVYFVNRENRERFIFVTVLASFIASVYGVLQYFGIEYIWPKVLNPFGGRSVSTFGNPNFLSSYLLLLFPVIYACYIQAKDSFVRLSYLVILVGNFAALLCTMTRSSWLGTFVAMMLMLCLIWIYEKETYKNKKMLLFFPFALFLLSMVVWPKSNVAGYNPTIIERLRETEKVQKSYYGPWHQRRLIWSCAWHMVIEKPFFGKGWGCFELFYPSYQGRHLFLKAYHSFRTHANNTHNEILEIWSQTGTIGLGVYLWLLWCIVMYGVFLIKNTEKNERLLAMALWSSILGMWVDNLLNVSLHFAVPGFLYWWNIGLLVSLGKNEERPIDLTPWVRRSLVYGLIVGGVFIIGKYGMNFLGEIHYFKGFKLSKRNEIMRSIPDLEKAHKFQRFEVNNNYELANSYARANLKEKAIEAYKESLRANAGYDEIYFNMATVLVQMGRMPEAIPEYTRALYINPLSYDAYTALGSIFLQNPDIYGKAGIALFEQCSLLFSTNKDIWNNLGYLYTKSGHDEKAIVAYKKAIEIDPDFDLARRNLKVSLAKLNKNDPFLDEVEALLHSVEKLVSQGDWQRALSQCRRLVKVVPSSFKAHFYLANIYFTIKDFSNAEDSYKKSLELRPSNPLVLTNMGLLYFEVRQFEMAKKMFEKTLAIDPGNNTAQQLLPQINQILNTQKK